MMSIYDQVKKALQDIVAPELQAVKAEIRRLDEKIDAQKAEIYRLDEKIDAQKAEFLSEIHRLDEKIDALRYEVRTALEIRERLAALEARVGISRG